MVLASLHGRIYHRSINNKKVWDINLSHHHCDWLWCKIWAEQMCWLVTPTPMQLISWCIFSDFSMFASQQLRIINALPHLTFLWKETSNTSIGQNISWLLKSLGCGYLKHLCIMMHFAADVKSKSRWPKSKRQIQITLMTNDEPTIKMTILRHPLSQSCSRASKSH